MVTLHDIFASKLSEQWLLYSRGSGDMLPHNILSGT